MFRQFAEFSVNATTYLEEVQAIAVGRVATPVTWANSQPEPKVVTANMASTAFDRLRGR
jgi:hypothetical protein